MRGLRALILVALAGALLPASAEAANCAGTSVGLTPLNDLGPGAYKGVQGGLYPGGANQLPADHLDAGRSLGRAIGPLDANGNLDPSGRYAFVSIGMSNTTQEFSTFKPLADADPDKDARLAIVDGAQGGQTGAIWANPSSAPWGVVDQRLAAAGVGPKQVSVAWVKLADAGPTTGWPAYAQTLQSETAAVLQNLKARYPNLQLAYLSSRIYAGYASTTLNPEPYAYEGGFSVKWLIEDQLDGSAALNFDPGRGDVKAPWVAWGPYLWADGLTPRSDGLTWACGDLSADGTHPGPSGRSKVAQMLLDFVSTDPTATEWFLRDTLKPGQDLAARKRQSIRKLSVKDTIDEPATFVAHGRVTVRGAKRAVPLVSVDGTAAGNRVEKIRLKLKRGRRAVARALRANGSASARVSVVATDFDGNSSTKRKRIHLRR